MPSINENKKGARATQKTLPFKSSNDKTGKGELNKERGALCLVRHALSVQFPRPSSAQLSKLPTVIFFF
jgi:hypothetical protein